MENSPHASMKQCPKCEHGHLLPATPEFFYVSKSHKDGFTSRCKQHYGKDRQPRRIIAEGHKYCPGCKMPHPATLEYFGACKTRGDGLDPYCKICAHDRRLAKYAQAKERGPKSPLPDKLECSVCGVPQPATLKFFTMNPQSRYRLNTTCKKCTNAAQKRNRQASPNRRVYEAQYNTIHKEQTTARLKRWYQEGGNEIVKANTRNRRARKRQAEGTHTAKDVQKQYEQQKGKCYWCGEKLTKFHADHITPIARGGTNWPDNIVIACPHCNVTRNDRLPHEWPEGGRLL